MNYSQIEKEALALIYGLRKFHDYLHGRPFTMCTDHKPLQFIFGRNRVLSKVANARIVRWALDLSSYEYEIEHVPGAKNCYADILSRMPTLEDDNDKHVNEKEGIYFITYENESVLDLTGKDLRECSKADKHISKVKRFLIYGWPISVDESDTAFWRRRRELSMQGGVVMWLDRIVIPEALRAEVLSKLHEGHPGMAAMKALARFYCWWPGMDHDIVNHIKGCYECQSKRPELKEMPLFPWGPEKEPWKRIHLDFAGPIGGSMYLIAIDAFSKWPEVCIRPSFNVRNTIECLKEAFARRGVPERIVTDNGPQFVARDFEHFCRKNGITHCGSSFYHPRTNGLVERFVGTLKSRTCAGSDSLQKLLLAYRNTPHAITGQSPAQMMMIGRIIPILFDNLKSDPAKTERIKGMIEKSSHDKKVRRFEEFEDKSQVWYRDVRHKKWVPASICSRKGQLSYEVETSQHPSSIHRLAKIDADKCVDPAFFT